MRVPIVLKNRQSQGGNTNRDVVLWWEWWVVPDCGYCFFQQQCGIWTRMPWVTRGRSEHYCYWERKIRHNQKKTHHHIGANSILLILNQPKMRSWQCSMMWNTGFFIFGLNPANTQFKSPPCGQIGCWTTLPCSRMPLSCSEDRFPLFRF
jgi:hypothetical protein